MGANEKHGEGTTVCVSKRDMTQVAAPPMPQVATPLSTTERVIDAAATVGRVTSYFSIAGSTIVLSITNKGGVHDNENIAPWVASVGVFLLVRKRRLVSTTRVRTTDRRFHRGYDVGSGHRRPRVHGPPGTASCSDKWFLSAPTDKIAPSNQATFSMKKKGFLEHK
jgi:hypothetical protein